jgi:hypothetical protein
LTAPLVPGSTLDDLTERDELYTYCGTCRHSRRLDLAASMAAVAGIRNFLVIERLIVAATR